MRDKLKLVLLIFLCLPQFSFSQVDNFARVTGAYPDFGDVSGTWGHYQYHRPFGLQGIVIKDWRDLTGISPLTSEPFNTYRQGWIPLGGSSTLWDQLHPQLTAPTDTIAPSTLVNYRQGDGIFKDFTLWYHNSLDKQTRFGWTSKLRSHPRIADATVYNEQRHRFQANSEGDGIFYQMEVGYDHRVNPLYAIAQDSSLAWYYDDTPQIRSDLWDGSIAWNNLDSNNLGTEIFSYVQGGNWTWSGGERRSIISQTYFKHSRDLFGLGTTDFTVGLISKHFGGNKRVQQFVEFRLPAWRGENYRAELGVRSLGRLAIFPNINLEYTPGPFHVGIRTHQIISERLWDSEITQAQIQELSGGLDFSKVSLRIKSWRGDDEGVGISGSSAEARFELPWQMTLMLGGDVLDMTSDWVFARQQFNWEILQSLVLFDNALHANLKVWGQHLVDTQPGMLDVQNFHVSNSPYPGEEMLNLLNYTISGQVSTVIISFTDQNMLHDELWSQYADIPWNLDYSLMTNQISNSRFRYVSIIWTFDN